MFKLLLLFTAVKLFLSNKLKTKEQIINNELIH